MNIYWFSFILTKFIGVVFKHEREIRDTREDEREEMVDREESVKMVHYKNRELLFFTNFYRFIRYTFGYHVLYCICIHFNPFAFSQNKKISANHNSNHSDKDGSVRRRH